MGKPVYVFHYFNLTTVSREAFSLMSCDFAPSVRPDFVGCRRQKLFLAKISSSHDTTKQGRCLASLITAPRVSITQFYIDIERPSISHQDYFQQCSQILTIQSVGPTSVRRAVNGHPASKFDLVDAKQLTFRPSRQGYALRGKSKIQLSTQFGRRI